MFWIVGMIISDLVFQEKSPLLGEAEYHTLKKNWLWLQPLIEWSIDIVWSNRFSANLKRSCQARRGGRPAGAAAAEAGGQSGEGLQSAQVMVIMTIMLWWSS